MSKVYESLVVEVLKNGDGLIDLPEEMIKENNITATEYMMTESTEPAPEKKTALT
jgi:hypothetical protein